MDVLLHLSYEITGEVFHVENVAVDFSLTTIEIV